MLVFIHILNLYFIGESMLKKQHFLEHHILQLATFAGKIILTNGGEVYRVEDTVTKIGKYFNLEINCFATLTCIIVSGKNSNGEIISLVERINSRSTNLDKIHRIHKLIDNINAYSFDSLQNALQTIDKSFSYGFGMNLIASALGAASFSIPFKGNANDFAASFIAGASVSIFSYAVSNLGLNSFFINLISGAICAFVANIFLVAGFI